jgi:hypothetical protein
MSMRTNSTITMNESLRPAFNKLSRLILLVAGIAATGSATIAFAATTTLDFGDGSINVQSAPVDSTAYFAAHGITLTTSPGATLFIADDRWIYGGGAIAATSPHNVLDQGGGHPVSYELDFSSAVSNLSFWRVAITTPSSLPQWSASLYNGATLVSSVGENFMGGTFAAQQYTLGGTGNRLVVNGDHGGFAAYQNVVIDDLSFTTVPEPGCLSLIGFGTLMLWKRRTLAA